MLFANLNGGAVNAHLTGIRGDRNLGRRTNQKLHNFWSHRQTIEWIRHMWEDYDMEFVQVPENMTSRTCCVCVHSSSTTEEYIVDCMYAKRIGR